MYILSKLYIYISLELYNGVLCTQTNYISGRTMFIAILVQTIVTISVAKGYSTGAPFAACKTTAPNHDRVQSSGRTTVHLDVSALNGTYIPNMNYTCKYRRQ